MDMAARRAMVTGVSRSCSTSVLVCAAFLAAAATLAPSAHAARQDGVIGLPKNESLLFSFAVDSGRATKSSERRLQLVLDGVQRSGTWFSDRPQRDSGTVSTRRFFSNWARLGFVADPPNAVLSLQGGRKDADTVAVELGRPHLSRSGGELRIAARLLRDPLPRLQHLNAKLDRKLPQEFGDATLFIDNATTSSSSCSVGEINYVAGDIFVNRPLSDNPRARGQLLSPEEYPELFALIGTRFGGDGQQTFRAPNLRGPDPEAFPVICASGDVPRASGPYPPQCVTGQIKLTASGVVPPGWLPTDGRTMQVQDFPALFAVMGAGFGGDGQTTFALPTLPASSGLAYLICTAGISWSPNDFSTSTGCTMAALDLFATPFTPPQHVPVRGQLLPIDQNEAIYSLIALTFGGDGESNFALPNVPGPIPSTAWSMCFNGIYPPFE
jgi:microcystin-dependent protein